MKPMIVHPGAHWSTHDCFVALTEALRGAGYPFAEFRLDGRIARAYEFLKVVQARMSEDEGKAFPDPTIAEITFQAHTGMVERAFLAECDALWLITGFRCPVELLRVARRAGLTVRVWFTESPYQAFEDVLAHEIDGCWTNERTCVPRFAGACQTAYLRHAWRAGLHDRPAERYDDQVAAHDVVFVGTYFPERLALLEAVDWTGIDLGLYGMTDMIPATSPLRAYVRSELTDNAVTAALYRRARVGLNLYRAGLDGQPPPESLNPRAYELAAAGACQLSEYRPEVVDVFGDSVPTFRSADELSASMRQLMASPARRQRLADDARDAVRTDHWGVRAQEMVASC